MKVYLDNGATTKIDKEVLKAMMPYLTKKYGNASSLHQFGKEAYEILEKSRETIAEKLNCGPEKIIFTSGGTESNNLAILGAAKNTNKKHIITSQFEHHSILETCKHLEKNGYKITYIKPNKEGFIDPNDIKNEITNDTFLVTIIYSNNEIGTIQPIEEIGRICKEKKILFHTDAVQAFTKTKLNLENVDLASFNAHKIHGPKGVGALYIKNKNSIKKLFYGGHQEFDLRAGTENIPGIVGFAKAVELSKESHNKEVEKLKDYLIKELLKIPKTKINGSLKNRICNNINISFESVEGESMLLMLDNKGIAVSTGSACSSSSLEPSHVLMSIGLKPEEAHSSLRITLSKYTTKQELDYFLKYLKKTVAHLRKISPLWKE